MDKYKITFETWNKVAQLYEDKFMDLDLYDDTYDAFCEEIKVAAPSILEIGCGPGNVTKYLLSKLSKAKLHGIDIAPNMVKLAKANNPTASFEVMDARSIDLLSAKYDAILCGFCLPYLSKEDVRKLFKDASRILNENGVIYLSCIEGGYTQSAFQKGSSGDRTYVYYYSEHELRIALNVNGFELIKVFRKGYKREKGEEVHLILLARRVV